MHWLELKVPPPLVALLVSGAMWGAAQLGTDAGWPRSIRLSALAIVGALGVATSLTAVYRFRRAGTTVHPNHPERAALIVTGGPYRFTRNPMYVGLTLVLIGWGLYLASPWAWFGPLALVLYLTRFQIIPEERILAEKFGAEYEAYRRRVRRWI